MDEAKQITIIQNLLKIPVEELNFNNQYVKISYANQCIGYIPCTFTPENIIYDISEEIVNKLKWAEIYLHNQIIINQNIIKIIGRDDIIVTIGNFRRLYVKEKDTNIFICAIICIYNDNAWSVEKEK